MAAPSPPPARRWQLSGEAPVVTIAFGRRDDRSEIDDGRAREPRALGDSFAAVAGSPLEELTRMGYVVPVAAAERLALDPVGAAAAIAQLLCDEDLLRRLAPLTDIRIEASHSMFGAIPWELAETRGRTLLAETAPIRCMYRSASREVSGHSIVAAAQAALGRALHKSIFVDGRLGPQSIEAVNLFQLKRGLPTTGSLDPRTLAALDGARRDEDGSSPPSVVVLERGVNAQRRAVRGSAAAGFSAVSAYKAAGWKTSVLHDPTRDELQKELKATRPRVLHVNASAAESSRLGGLFLDIGREVEYERSPSQRVNEEARRAEGFSVTDFIDCLRPEVIGPPPLLVLDPPSVPSRHEATRQLLLRNAFASDLFQLGILPAIVATGLVEPFQGEKLAMALAQGLWEGTPLPAVCAAMRRAARRTEPSQIAYPNAIAVFAHYADYSPWPSLQR
jgi:hypothetical protein